MAGNIIGIAVTTAAAIAVLFACGTQINIVRAYAWKRVEDESLRVLDREEVLESCVFWTGVVAAASLLFSVGLVSLSLKMWQIAAGIVFGATVMLVSPLCHRADRGLPVIQPSRLPTAGAGRAIPPHSRPGHAAGRGGERLAAGIQAVCHRGVRHTLVWERELVTSRRFPMDDAGFCRDTRSRQFSSC